MFLHTDVVTSTPVVSDLSISYTTSCTPPGQAYFGDILADTYTVEVTQPDYVTTSQEIVVDGDLYFSINLLPN